ncbi:MAG: cupin domain-containing protein [Gammaproteobacteria bacterium]
MKTHTQYQQINAFTTRDGSTIRELMHPEQHGNCNQSLAEARIEIAQETRLHRHHRSEELYHITRGHGLMTLGDSTFEVEVGDTIQISPGTAHKICNTGDEELIILCCCAPAYDHDDTELL